MGGLILDICGHVAGGDGLSVVFFLTEAVMVDMFTVTGGVVLVTAPELQLIV